MSRPDATPGPPRAHTRAQRAQGAASPDVPMRLALRVEEAAAALGVRPDAFREHIAPELPWVRRGRLKLVSVAALERWLAANEERTLG